MEQCRLNFCELAVAASLENAPGVPKSVANSPPSLLRNSGAAAFALLAHPAEASLWGEGW
jgi:hypothetical protein